MMTVRERMTGAFEYRRSRVRMFYGEDVGGKIGEFLRTPIDEVFTKERTDRVFDMMGRNLTAEYGGPLLLDCRMEDAFCAVIEDAMDNLVEELCGVDVHTLP